MICLSIGEPGIIPCRRLLQDGSVELAEIRLDGAELSAQEIMAIFSLPVPLIATCRPSNGRSESQRQAILETAIKAGAAYVDIEIETGDAFLFDIINKARRHEVKVIISYHNYELTPPASELKQVLRQCFEKGADIAKIACTVHSQRDSARLLSLYTYEASRDFGDSGKSGQIVALGMGEHGKITRIAAPLLGAPFTFASPSEGTETAPGQLSQLSLKEIYNLITPTKSFD